MQINKNILSDELSPYLKQHQDNPVHWQTWSEETLNYAKKNSKNIFNCYKKMNFFTSLFTDLLGD